MKINSDLIVQLRKQRAWSQQHLSEICELSLRTIQRVENNGSGSFETLQSLAATFEIRTDSLVVKELPESPKYLVPPEKKTSRAFSLRKAIGTSAVVLSLLGSFILTSGTTAASDVKIEATSMTMSQDRTTDTFTGNVQIFIPRHISFTITSGNELEPSESGSHLTVQTEIGTIVIADAEISVHEAGLSISAEKAVMRNLSRG